MPENNYVKRIKSFLTKQISLPPISSICSILLGGIIAIVSTVSFVIDIISTQNLIAIVLDLVVMTISYLTVWQGLYFSIATKIANDRMEEQWKIKIDPLIKLIEQTAGKIDEIEKDVATTNVKLNTTMEYIMQTRDMDASKAYIVPGMSFRFISKILVLISFTFASLVYVSSYPLGIVHYFIMVIYLIWWLFITIEYKLFGSTTAWIFVIIPLLLIPSLGIIISAVYGLNIMIGILFLALFIYIAVYYTWASYSTTGYSLIDMKQILFQIKTKLKRKTPVISKEDLTELVR